MNIRVWPMQWRSFDTAVLTVAAVGLVSLALSIYSHRLWQDSLRRTMPMVDNLTQAKAHLAKGYLFTEKLVAGDTTVRAADVLPLFDRAEQAIADCASGKSAIAHITGVPPSDKDLLKQLRDLESAIRNFRALAERRWNERGVDVVKGSLAQRVAFHGLEKDMDAITQKLGLRTHETMARQQRLHAVMLTVWLGFLVGSCAFLLVLGRRHRRARNELAAARDELELRVRERTRDLEHEIVEHKRAAQRERLATEVLELLNRPSGQTGHIREILRLIKESSDFEAVGLRLQEGEDFPYYETAGFSGEFVAAERYLCERGPSGELVQDSAGNPVLECMCGNVIRGRTDPSLPFFTEGGSFWTNSTTELLATTTEEDRQARTRDRCNGEGYESVALIPLRAGEKTIGLLQLNDRRKDQFTPENIAFFEELGSSIGIAVEHKRADQHIVDLARFPSENPYPVLRMTKGGVLLYSNAAAESLLRARDCRIGEAAPEEWRILIAESVRTDSTAQLDVEHKGRVVSFHVVPVAGADYVNWYGQDATEIRQAAADLQESNEMLLKAQRVAKMGFLTWNLKTNQIDWSVEVFELYGIDREKVKPTIELTMRLVHPDDLDYVRKNLDLAIKGIKRYDIDHRILRSDEKTIWVHAQGDLVRDADGNPEFLLGAVVNITERKQAEEERRKLEARVQHAQKLESLGVLAGGIAHDFNNLLMAILGNADLTLRELSASSPARAGLGEIKKACVRAAELCKQMLAYSGKGRFDIKPIDLSELVEEMTHMLEVSISKKAVLRYDFADHLPAVQADSTQMRQIVMNLITNASEAIGDKSGVISISTGIVDCDRAYLDKVHLAQELSEGLYVYLEVADTGCGMDEETRPKVFDPFYTTKFAGRGLGLAAVLGIVRGHNGAIKIYSEPRKGTTFKILLPVVEESAQSEARGRQKGAEWRGSGAVLLVDDEDSVRATVGRMLKTAGFTVLTAADGREALPLFLEHQDSIVCVVLDLSMPDMDGEETFRELRRIDAAVRVILSSGYNEQDVVQRFAGKGLAGFIQKPYVYDDLVAVIRRTLNA